MTVKIAIIGSGPSGMYAMDGANKYIEDCQIDIIDRLPTPYGLVRAGVAPDHLGTKNVSNQYEKAIAKGDIQYFGNIEVGKDISIEELQKHYDAIVIATGAPVDRKLGIVGEDLDGVYGSGEFVGWYNGHPDHINLSPDMSAKSIVVIGNGNVSLDISRLLVKTPNERSDTDIPSAVSEKFDLSNIADVYLVGRRGPMQTSFTPPELRELGRLDNAVPIIDSSLISAEEVANIDDSTPSGRILKKAQDIFSHFSEIPTDGKSSKVHLVFLASPTEILGEGKVSAVRFEKNKLEDGKAIGTGDFFDIEADMVITAIGYRSRPINGLEFDSKAGLFPNNEGHIASNIYVVGWGKRGPSGTIPTNRPDSFGVSKLMAEQVTAGGKDGRIGLNKLIIEHNLRTTSFDDWKVIDTVETSRAIPPKPREKITSIEEMLAALEEN